MTIHLHTMATARARCAELGITAARSLAETVERIKAKEAEMQRDAYRAAHPEIAAEGAKLCDCDPVGDAAREHYQGLGKQPCDCELSHNGCGMSGRECDCPAGYIVVNSDTIPAASEEAQIVMAEADYSGIEARVLAHMALPADAGFTTEVGTDGIRRVTGMHPVMAAPYGTVPGRGDAIMWKRSRPRQDVGPISRYMSSVETAFLGLSLAHRKGPRRSSTYRAARRNEAKHFRREARDQGTYRVPA